MRKSESPNTGKKPNTLTDSSYAQRAVHVFFYPGGIVTGPGNVD
jgi:hypothetical protein